MAGSAEMVLRLLDLSEVKGVTEAARALVAARAAGADCYEARHEVDALERALAVLDGVDVEGACSVCCDNWEPRHFHLGEFNWVSA